MSGKRQFPFHSEVQGFELQRRKIEDRCGVCLAAPPPAAAAAARLPLTLALPLLLWPAGTRRHPRCGRRGSRPSLTSMTQSRCGSARRLPLPPTFPHVLSTDHRAATDLAGCRATHMRQQRQPWPPTSASGARSRCGRSWTNGGRTTTIAQTWRRW